MQNSGKTKPGFYPVIGLLGAAGKLGKKSFVNNAARWNTGALVKMFFNEEKLFSHLRSKNQNRGICLQSSAVTFKHPITGNTVRTVVTEMV